MVDFEDLGGPQGSLGALGGVLGGSWELQGWLLEGLGGSRKTGHRIWRLQGGVWERSLAIQSTVHVRQILIFITFFLDFRKLRFF